MIVSSPRGETARTLGPTRPSKALETRASIGFSGFIRGAPGSAEQRFGVIFGVKKIQLGEKKSSLRMAKTNFLITDSFFHMKNFPRG